MAKLIQPQADPRKVIRGAEYVRMSTDQQKYSILNQSALIQTFAKANQIEIVATYADPGKSGLTMRSRPGLSKLLSDIVGGKANFEVVLVYDISRWGRFQDADESAHYEFLCRRAGIRVMYCAEQFGPEGQPLASVLKALKRAMAGEFSRELSTKTALGKARIASLGFRTGGIPGCGLRRRVLQGGSTHGVFLHEGDRKNLQSDRVTLVPGPAEEIALVHRIYREYIYLRKLERQIAADLNADGHTFAGRAWTRYLVQSILTNEKYIGISVSGRTVRRLTAPAIRIPCDQWVRFEGAFTPLVSSEVFQAAARVRRFNADRCFSDEELLESLRVILKREGRLSVALVAAEPGLPPMSTFAYHFGSISRAYEKLGFTMLPRHRYHDVDRALVKTKTEQGELLLQMLQARGIECSMSRNVIGFKTQLTIEVLMCRHQEPMAYRCSGWRIAHRRNSGSSHILALRMALGNQAMQDFLLLPRSEVAGLPHFLRANCDEQLARFRYADLSNVGAAIAEIASGF
jgi:DNA invertase Pin-like site-specific DNA recombinase